MMFAVQNPLVFGKNIVKLQLDMFGKEYALLEEIHNE